MAPSTRQRKLKTGFHSENKSNAFCPPPRRENSKTQQSLVILESCLKNNRSGKSRDYRDVILRSGFKNVFHAHENEKKKTLSSNTFKSVFEKLRFSDGLV